MFASLQQHNKDAGIVEESQEDHQEEDDDEATVADERQDAKVGARAALPPAVLHVSTTATIRASPAIPPAVRAVFLSTLPQLQLHLPL